MPPNDSSVSFQVSFSNVRGHCSTTNVLPSNPCAHNASNKGDRVADRSGMSLSRSMSKETPCCARCAAIRAQQAASSPVSTSRSR